MSKFITRLLPLLSLILFQPGGAGAQQVDHPPSLKLGDAVVSGFSGTVPSPPGKTFPRGKSAVDFTFINPDGPSVRVFDLARPGYVWDGRLFAAPKTFDVYAKDVGQVFGIALDDQTPPNIYVAATSMFGLNIVSRGRDGTPERKTKGGPGAGWMKGQFGLDLQGGPGGIYKIDGRTGVASLFANVTLDGVPNPGPGLGNLAYDSAHKQLFVSDLYTGMIHRFDLDGKELSHYDHGVTGLGVAKLATVAFNARNRPNIASDRFDSEKPDTWGFAPAQRRIWGLAVHEGRLYYSVLSGPQIWSIGFERDGSFAADPRWELDIPAQAGPLPISDIAFSHRGAMILAQRALIAGAYDYSAFTRPGEPQVFRVWLKGPNDPPSPGRWKLIPEEYAIGFAGNYRNTNGGVALGYGYGADGALNTNACEFSLWTTAQNIRNAPALKSRLDPGGPLVVHGLAGVPASPVRDVNTPPWLSYAVDYDDTFRDPRATGHLGSVRIYVKPCAAPSAYNGPGYPATSPYIATNIVTPIDCIFSGNCPPPGTSIDLGVGKIGEFNPNNPKGPYNFTIGVRNLGAAITSPQTITVTDVVPAGMTFTSVTSTNWTCAPAPVILSGGTVTCTYTGSFPLASNQSLGTIDIVATGGAGPYINCANLGQPDNDPSNNQACIPVQSGQVGELVVKKVVVSHVIGTQLPPQNYTVNVTCGGTTTALILTDGGSQTVSNIPYGTNCTVAEVPPTVPPKMCQSGSSGVWTISYVPPQPVPPIVINGVTTTVTVTNTFDCVPDNGGGNGSLIVNKTVINNTNGAVSTVGLSYPVTATCGGVPTSLTLTESSPGTVGNLALGTNCSVQEGAYPTVSCPTDYLPSWSTVYLPSASVTVTGLATPVTVQNTLDCKIISAVRVAKLVINNTPAADVSGLSYPMNVSCVTGTMPPTTLPVTVTGGSSWTLHNIPSGSVCTVSETPPPPPTTGCPAGSVPNWVTPPAYTPPSVTTSSGAPPVLTVTNTLNCVPTGGGSGDQLVVTKSVINNTTNHSDLTGYTYPVTVSCVSGMSPATTTQLTLVNSVPQTVSSIASGASCTVTEDTGSIPTPPNACGHGFPVWSTTYTPTLPVTVSGTTAVTVQNTLDCKPYQTGTGYLAVKKFIVNTTAADLTGMTFPAVATCVGAPPANLSLNVIGAQRVYNVPLNASCTVVETLPPAPTTGCGQGKVPTWVSSPSYAPSATVPMVLTGNIGPTITVTNTLTCLPPSQSSMCPDGKPSLPGKECVPQPACKAPMVPGPVGGACVCPDGKVKKGLQCVETISCHSPAKPNKAGTACICPGDMTMKGGACIEKKKIEKKSPSVSPGDVIRIIPGLGGGGIRGGGGGGGGGVSPGGGGAIGKH